MSLRPYATVAALLALLALGCMSSEERIANHLERARVYDESGQLNQALVELQSALRLDPQSAETNYLTGELMKKMQRFEDSIFFYEEAHRIDPNRDDAKLGIARLLRLSDTQRATKLVDEVLSRSPQDVEAHLIKSDIGLAIGDPEASLAAALTAQELAPDSTRAALQVGFARKGFIAYARKTKQELDPKRFPEADAAFARAIELAKRDDDLRLLMRATTERAEVEKAWHGHSPAIGEMLKSTYELVQQNPVVARELALFTTNMARRGPDMELLVWALSRATELEPWNYFVWRELADLAVIRGDDPMGILDRMVETRPSDPDSYVTYAEFLSDRGQNAEALAYLESAPADVDRPEAILTARFAILVKMRQLDKATEVLTRLRTEYPESAQTYFAEAVLANHEGRWADAERALVEWTSRQETANGFGMLAQARIRGNKPREALEAIDRALALSQRPRPDYQRMRGRILVLLSDYEGSIRSFQASLRYNPQLPLEFVPDYARALYGRGSDKVARRVIEPALEVESPAPTALLLFGREEMERDPKRAREQLERGAKLYPNMPAFGQQLVVAELRAGDNDAALARARALAAQLPDQAGVQIQLTRTLLATGEVDEAVQQVEALQQRWMGLPGVAELYLDVMTRAGRGDEAFQALSAQRAAGTLLPSARVLLARLHTARGEEDQAIELLRSALADQPDLPGAQNDLAYRLALRGEEMEYATELAQEARANRPDSPEIADTLGYVYLRRNLGEAALVQFDAALELAEPGSSGWAIAQYHRGLALRQLGRQAEAVAALEQALASGADFRESKEAHQALAELSSAAKAGGPEGS